MEKKKMKKLILKKDEIVNLNEFQMKSIQGGTSSWPCAGRIIKSAISAYSAAKDLYSMAKDASLLTCEAPNPGDWNASQKIVNLPDGSQACELPEVYIYGYRQ